MGMYKTFQNFNINFTRNTNKIYSDITAFYLFIFLNYTKPYKSAVISDHSSDFTMDLNCNCV